MTDSRACPHCGAHVPRLDARFCEFCGTEIPLPAADASGAPPSPNVALQHRFAALDAHAELQKLMLHMPMVSFGVMSTLIPVVFLLVFIAVAIFMLGPFSQAPLPFALMPLVFVGFGVFGLVSIIKRASRFRTAPLRRQPAVVADERAQVSGGGRNASARTSYYVTLEYPDGTREEVRTRGDMAGKVAPGDMGIAYLKDRYLVEFRRVAV